MQRLAKKSFATDLLNSLTAHLAVLNSQGDIIAVNNSWKYFARENDSADKNFYVGTNYLTVCENSLKIEHNETIEKVLNGIRAVARGERDEFSLEYPCNSPTEERWFIVRTICFEHNEDIYIVVSHENITARKKVEKALSESRERYRKLTQSLPDAIYTLDLATRLATYFNHDSFLGYSREELIASGSIMNKVHPEDAQIVTAHWQQLMRGEETTSIEYRIRNKAGQWEWVESREIVVSKSEDGTPKDVMVVLTLITERKQAEEQIKYQAKILANVNDAIIGTDENLVITHWNPTAERIFGWNLSEVIGRTTPEVLRTKFSDTERAESIRLLSETGNWKGEVMQHTRDNKPVIFEANIMAIRNKEGKTTGYVAANRDITKRKQAEGELLRAKEAIEVTNRELQAALTREQALARTDGLTGICNRRHFFDLAEHDLAITKRYGRPLSLIIFDIDNFKKINDEHGHQVGDDVLRRVASIAQSHLREADILARYGGDEFIILLPDSDLEQAKVVAERIRENVAAHREDVDNANATVSIGIAEFLPQKDSLDNLIGHADQALYAAKQTGRNCVRVYSLTN